MKKTALALFLCILFFTSAALAAGTITQSTPGKITVDGSIKRKVITLTCTADASNGSFPTTGGAVLTAKTLEIEGWYLYSVETNPGTTAPTDNYDIAITNAHGRDVAGGLLANRDTSNTEIVFLGGIGYPVITGNLTVAITGNSVNSAGIVIELVFVSN